MAEKQIVREDIISISFDVDNSGIAEIKGLADEIKASIASAVDSASGSLQEMAENASEVADSVEDIKEPLESVKETVEDLPTPVDDVTDSLKESSDEAKTFAEKLKAAVNSGVEKLKHPIETVKTALGSAKDAASGFVSKLKDIGKQKITSVKNSLSEIKEKLTEGKSGASGLLTALKNVAKVSMSSLKSELGGVAEKLSSVAGKAVKWTATGITAAAGGITAGLTACINVGKEYESAMSQVAATMGITADTAEYETLSAAAKEMGATTAFSATEAAEALNYLALAGYDADKAAGALPTVLNLAGAGAMDLATASDMVTDAMSALGIEATSTNLTEFSDKLAVTAQKSNTSVSQLGEAILTVGGTAKNMAGGTTELTAALGTLANVGLKGAEGGTHLRNLLLSLQSPTDEATDLIEKMGISVYDTSGNMRGINDIFKDLKSSMEGMSNAEVDNILSTIFNKTDLAAAQGMLSGCEDSFDSLVANIDNSAGACEEMYKTMLDNLDGDIAIFQSGLSALGNSIYEEIQSPLRGIVQDVTGIISDMSTAFEEGGFEGLASAVGDGLARVVNIITDYAPTVAELAITMIGGLLDGLLNNMDSIVAGLADTATSLASGICTIIPQVLMGAFEAAESVADGIADILPDVLNSVLEGIIQILTDFPGMVEAAINIITTLVDGIIAAIPVLVEQAPVLIQAFCDGILSSIDLIVNGALTLIDSLVAAIIDNLPSIIDAAVEIVIALVTGLVEAIPKLVNGAIELIYALVNGLIECMPMIIQAAIQLIIGLAEGLIQNLPTIVQAAIQLIVGLAGGILQMLPEIIALGVQLVLSLAIGLIQAIPDLVAMIPQILKAIWDTLTDIDFWISLGKSIISGIWEGIKSIGSSIGDGIKSLFTGGSDDAESSGRETASAYAASLSSGLTTTSFDTSAITSGLSLDLMSSGVSSATTWNSGFDTVLGTTDSTTGMTADLQSSLDVDLTTAGESSAATWSTGFDTSLGTDGIEETVSTAEQLKESMTVDLTTEGAATAESWNTGFTDSISSASSSVASELSGSMSEMQSTVSAGMNKITAAVKSGADDIVKLVKKAAESVKSVLAGLDLSSTGKNIMSGLITGMKSKQSELLSYVNSLADAIADTMNTALDINSPSKVMYEIGEFTALGFIGGVSSEIPAAESSASALSNVYAGDTENVYTGGNSTSETNNYNPTFNLTISGVTNEREMKRKVQQWIIEAMDKIDASEMRKSPQYQIL